ncbi:MAG: replicative DNA helicase [Verrucomicrobia bacterium]|nr:replicative DNA helicase [Kiritimatiellia bacterium]MCP5488762.1 replicative DNA helicase [Verrucomicrobiota bacterium]
MASTAGQDKPVRRGEPVPPHSLEAERAVLGSILIDAERVLDLSIERGLSEDSFYAPQNRALYGLLRRMHDEHKPCDLVATHIRAGELKLLDQIGGVEYLEELFDNTPTAARAGHFVDVVRQKHLLRTILDRARIAMDLCYDEEDEADRILDRVEQSFYDISENQINTMEDWAETVSSTMKELHRIIDDKRGITGVPTGFLDLDNKTKGFQPGDMIIIAARPSMGKTSLAMNIAENVATGDVSDKKKRKVAVFSLEMSTGALAKRMLCSRAGVPYHKLFDSYVGKNQNEKLMSAASVLAKADIFVDDTPGLEPTELRAKARRLKKRHEIDLIVIDYLQMMNFSTYAREGRQRETAAISGAIKAMAKELHVPVIVLSQLSRAPETRDRLAKPKLSDLRDSGSIEQDADVVCLLRRPCKYPDDEESGDTKLAILDVAKHRNGPTGEVRLNFEDELTRFETRYHGTDGSPPSPPSGP